MKKQKLVVKKVRKSSKAKVKKIQALGKESPPVNTPKSEKSVKAAKVRESKYVWVALKAFAGVSGAEFLKWEEISENKLLLEEDISPNFREKLILKGVIGKLKKFEVKRLNRIPVIVRVLPACGEDETCRQVQGNNFSTTTQTFSKDTWKEESRITAGSSGGGSGQSITLSGQVAVPFLEFDKDPVLKLQTPEGRKILSDTEVSADYFAIEFVETLRRVGTTRRGGLRRGDELDDPTEAIVSGAGFSSSTQKSIGTFDIHLVLDASGSTRDYGSHRFSKIGQAAFFLDRIARKVRQGGGNMSISSIIFGALCAQMKEDDIPRLIHAVDNEVLASWDRKVMHPDLWNILKTLGGDTSLESGIRMSLDNFKPQDYGLLVVLTDDAVKDKDIIEMINCMPIPEKISPVMVSIGVDTDVISQLGGWTGITFPDNTPREAFLGQFSQYLTEKAAEIREKVGA